MGIEDPDDRTLYCYFSGQQELTGLCPYALGFNARPLRAIK
jgi:hypothetical protein